MLNNDKNPQFDSVSQDVIDVMAFAKSKNVLVLPFHRTYIETDSGMKLDDAQWEALSEQVNEDEIANDKVWDAIRVYVGGDDDELDDDDI